MKSFTYISNGEVKELSESNDLVAVRTVKGTTLSKALKSKASQKVIDSFKVKQKVSRANVTILEVKKTKEDPLAERNKARTHFNKENDIRFAGRVLVDKQSNEPVLYTENIFIQFVAALTEKNCLKIIQAAGLTVKEHVAYAPNTYFLQAPEGIGFDLFAICKKLDKKKEVLYCEPELIRKTGKKKAPKINSKQWHLKTTKIGKRKIVQNAHIEEAHKLSLGKGVIIAVIDDGVDIRHEEFSKKGKVIYPLDIASKTTNCLPRTRWDNHGTACAGVACASGNFKACGVAPLAKLMPIRNDAELGSKDEADAIVWAVDHGADIISCSWGPDDGAWWDPKDKLHKQHQSISPLTNAAIQYAVAKGRKGKGCLILFAAGNGNESADLDMYISHPDVIAVAACNDRGQKSIYSDYGKSIWVSFPSNDFESALYNHPAPLTPGIWTTDRLGSAGYKRNNLSNYHQAFGGTSSACPGVAGVCALILSAKPSLSYKQVKNILRKTADKIDVENAKYNQQGHSDWYGYGRVNAAKAVEMAMKMK